MFTVSGKFLPVILVLILLFSAKASIEEEFLPHTHTLREMALRLDVIEERYQEIEFEIAVEQLLSIRQQCDFLMPGLESSQQQEASQLIARTLLVEMVLHYYQENKSDAETLAKELLQRDPSAVLSGTLATPELAGWFEDIRDQHIGFLTVKSSPSGAIVYLDDMRTGLTPLENAFAPAGTRNLLIQKDGYESVSKQIAIEHNEISEIDVLLKRNTGSLIIWVSPPGTLIEMDHMSVPLVTRPVPSFLYSTVFQLGLYPSMLSEPLKIDAIPIGERKISLSKDCRETLEYRISFDAADYFLPIIMLPESATLLTLYSTPIDGNVYLDGQFIGVTPILDKTVCPGERRISVDYGNGVSWSQTILLKPDDSAEFTATPRPDLIFLGCFSSYQDLCASFEKTVHDFLEESNVFNISDKSEIGRYRLNPSVASVLESLSIPDFKPDDQAWLDKLQDMVASMTNSQSQLIAFARPVPPTSDGKSLFVFMHRQSANPDVLYFNMESDDFSDSLNYLAELIQLPALSRLRSGLRVTEMDGQLFITEIIPGSSAELSPLQPGDKILTMNNIPVNSRNLFEQILRSEDSPELMKLNVLRDDKPLHAEIEMKRQALIPSLSDANTPYNLYYTYLSILSFLTQPNPEWLSINLGVCKLAMKRPNRAAEYLHATELSDKEGIGTGTLSWLKHLAANAMRNTTEADYFLRQARNSEGSTIIHGDGPLLEDLLQ